MAVVLTHDAPESLVRCLASICAQTRPPDAVLVVDNASDPAVVLPPSPLPVTLVRSEHNGGPAGGHEIGLRTFLESSHDLAWVMDDDCIPTANCLEELLAASAGPGYPEVRWAREPSRREVLPVASRDAVADTVPVFPCRVEPTGIRRFPPAWSGFLMPRKVVELIGLPRVDLVWWTEDTEYLCHRMGSAGIRPIRAERAIVDHHRVRTGASKPPWKFYYEVRNTIAYRVYTRDRSWAQVFRTIRQIARLVVRIILREPGKLVRLRAVLDGVGDGLRRRSGLRYPLNSKV